MKGTTGHEIDEEGINHARQYNQHPSGIEPIDLIEHLPFNIGTAIKYLMRYRHKGQPVKDLRKAHWYVLREAERLQAKEHLPIGFRSYRPNFVSDLTLDVVSVEPNRNIATAIARLSWVPYTNNSSHTSVEALRGIARYIDAEIIEEKHR